MPIVSVMKVGNPEESAGIQQYEFKDSYVHTDDYGVSATYHKKIAKTVDQLNSEITALDSAASRIGAEKARVQGMIDMIEELE